MMQDFESTTEQHELTLLAESGRCRIYRCCCGTIKLQAGAVTLGLDPRDLPRLAKLFARAATASARIDRDRRRQPSLRMVAPLERDGVN